MKKLFALAISLIMLLGALSAFPVFATETAGETQANYTDVVTMTSLYNGNKTVVAGTVYSVSSAEELLMFNEICNTNNQTFDGATVIITKDIDLNEGWTASATAPTNVWGAVKIFKGVLDGQNHTLKGFYVADSLDYKKILNMKNADGTDASEHAGGIFCVLSGKTCAVKNLNIENSYIHSTKFAGSIAGVTDPTVDCNGLAISNVTSSAIIKSDGNGAGGILGDVFNGNAAADSFIYINDCEFSGEVYANNQVGGFVGTGWRNINITNCVNKGKICSLVNSNIGGIYGNPQGGAVTITSCVNEGELVMSNITETNVGGIVGCYNGTTKLTVDGCVNKSDISCNVTGSKPNLGGIVGISKSNNATIKNCVNLGDIILTLNGTPQNHEVGGIIGHSTGNALTVSNCANFGDIKSENKMGCTVGGIVGSIGCAVDNTNAQKITDCLSAGDISVELCTPGGIIGVFQRQNLTITRCAFTGTVTKLASGNNGAYGGTMMGNLNNSTNITFEDCYFNNAYKPLPTWTGVRPAYGNQVITVKATGKDTVTQTYTAGKNPSEISNALKAAGALSKESMLDLNAIQNLTALDWVNTWKIEKVDGEYIPVPITVASLIAEEKTEKDNGVDYKGVQVALDKTAVRFVSTVDKDLYCEKIGFDVLIIKGGKHATYTLEDDTVYESLLYTNLSKPEGEQSEVLTVDGKYLGALAFTGIDSDVTFAVKTYSKIGDEKTYDDTYIVSYDFESGKVFTYVK